MYGGPSIAHAHRLHLVTAGAAVAPPRFPLLLLTREALRLVVRSLLLLSYVLLQILFAYFSTCAIRRRQYSQTVLVEGNTQILRQKS